MNARVWGHTDRVLSADVAKAVRKSRRQMMANSTSDAAEVLITKFTPLVRTEVLVGHLAGGAVRRSLQGVAFTSPRPRS